MPLLNVAPSSAAGAPTAGPAARRGAAALATAEGSGAAGRSGALDAALRGAAARGGETAVTIGPAFAEVGSTDIVACNAIPPNATTAAADTATAITSLVCGTDMPAATSRESATILALAAG